MEGMVALHAAGIFARVVMTQKLIDWCVFNVLCICELVCFVCMCVVYIHAHVRMCVLCMRVMDERVKMLNSCG